MTWVDCFDSHPYLTIFVIILLQLPIVYQLSVPGKYFIRMTLYYVTVVVAGTFASFPSIPTYFLNRGGAWAMKTFQLFTLWVDVEVETRGKEKLECDGQIVIVSNHQSSLDVIPLAVCWPDRCTVMMKKSLQYVPGFNISSTLCNTIFVNRFNHDKAQDALEQAAETMSKKNLKLWIFPEGTRSRDQNMLPFKKGAFNIAIRAQIPVFPVVFSSYLPFYSKDKMYFHNNGQVIAEVLDPISTKGMTIDEAPALADRVRSIMMETFEKISKEAEEKQKLINERFNHKIDVAHKKSN